MTRAEPDEVYNLAGQSSVGLSFDHPVETFQSIAVGTLNLLQAIRSTGSPIRFFNAGSGDCFADTGKTPANEETPFRPRSPYAVAKVAAYWQVANYRDAYGLQACTGIMFNHESPLRSARFVTRKIVDGAVKIAGGLTDELRLGDISIRRDWGWAPEYVAAMWTMLQQPSPRDYVIATGESHTLEEFVDAAFSTFGLDWHAYVRTDRALFRPSDIHRSEADPSRARREIGWHARYGMSDVVKMMIEDAAHADGSPGAATGPQ